MTGPLISGVCEILVEYIMRNNSFIYFDFGPVVQEMSVKVILYLDLSQPLCSMEQNDLCNFDREHHEEQFCEIMLNSDHLKTFLV